MEYRGKIIKGLGGLYEVRLPHGGQPRRLSCRARGALHRDEWRLEVGDEVRVTWHEGEEDAVIEEVLPRRNALIRPPMANLDELVLTVAAAQPKPVLFTADKLLAIAEHNGISCSVVVTKTDLDAEAAEKIAAVYRTAGYPVFLIDNLTGEGTDAVAAALQAQLRGGRTAAFAGASGVGKSSLLNRIFPQAASATGAVSERIGRGRHTTRHVELFPYPDDRLDCGYLADTPGFGLLDFTRFDFFALSDLLPAFPDLCAHATGCRYADCTHVCEEGCALLDAVARGEVAPSRHESYCRLRQELSDKERRMPRRSRD